MEEALRNILSGVRSVPKYGQPGSLVVFEQNAYPILTGDDTSSVLFAAAEIGQGRVFVCTHELYIEHFLEYTNEVRQLWKNVKFWLTKGKFVRNQDIQSISNYQSVVDIPEDVKLIKWLGTDNKTELFINQFLKKYISNGGAVLCAMSPTNWTNVSHGKSMDEMSLNKFLSSCGICFSLTNFSSCKFNCFDVNKNLAMQAHFGNSINILANNMNEAVKLQSNLINGLASLPNQIAPKYLEKLHKILYTFICSKYQPTSKTSVTCPIGRALLSICSKVYQKYSACGIRIKAPNIEEFPGNYPSLDLPNTTTVIVEIKSKYDEFHCTGYYIMADSTVRVTVLEGNSSGWEVRIGCHTDDLSNMNVLKRWPNISSTVKLSKYSTITSAYGGLIYLESPKGNSRIRIKLENVIEAPYYDLTKIETISNWSQRSRAPGLWAELSGKYITFTVPSNLIRNLIAPRKALELWDRIVESHHELRGTNPANTWRERIVFDIQPHSGNIHAGYPIVLPYDYIKEHGVACIFDTNRIKQTCWTLVHELGHNMQRDCWTPSGSEEITVNIFTLHTFNLVFGEKPWFNRILKEKLDHFDLDNLFKSNETFTYENWSTNSYVGLLIYAQLINSFGWAAFKTIFREYESLSDKEKIFKTDLDKWDQWICRFSNIVGLDITPLFYFWSIPYSNKPGTNLSDLTPWLPDDELTRRFPKRIDYVKLNFNDLVIGNESNLSSCARIIYPYSDEDNYENEQLINDNRELSVKSNRSNSSSSSTTSSVSNSGQE